VVSVKQENKKEDRGPTGKEQSDRLGRGGNRDQRCEGKHDGHKVPEAGRFDHWPAGHWLIGQARVSLSARFTLIDPVANFPWCKKSS
jgi:hypothetical protein